MPGHNASLIYLDLSQSFRHKVMTVCMKLLSFVWRNLLFLNQGWGGGFDITYCFNGRFHHVNEVVYAFWVCEVESWLVYINRRVFFIGFVDDLKIDVRNIRERQVLIKFVVELLVYFQCFIPYIAFSRAMVIIFFPALGYDQLA